MTARSWLLCGLVACGGAGDKVGDSADTGTSTTLPDEWVEVVHIDEGTACIEAPTGADLSITVTYPDCLSSSCDRNFVGTCSADLEGDILTITSDLRWETLADPQTCTDDCGFIVATCTFPALPDGIYTIAHGSESYSEQFPNDAECGYY